MLSLAHFRKTPTSSRTSWSCTRFCRTPLAPIYRPSRAAARSICIRNLSFRLKPLSLEHRQRVDELNCFHTDGDDHLSNYAHDVLRTDLGSLVMPLRLSLRAITHQHACS